MSPPADRRQQWYLEMAAMFGVDADDEMKWRETDAAQTARLAAHFGRLAKPVDLSCPWCGEDVDDTPLLMVGFDPDGVAHVDCAECGKPVIVTRQVSISYHVEREAAND